MQEKVDLKSTEGLLPLVDGDVEPEIGPATCNCEDRE